jgi:hypothetical protein
MEHPRPRIPDRVRRETSATAAQLLPTPSQPIRQRPDPGGVREWPSHEREHRTISCTITWKCDENVNTWDNNDAIQDLIRSGHSVDQVRLADPAVPRDEVADTHDRSSS